MSIITLLLYAAVLGVWMSCVHREGGIGIGVRFLFAFNMVQMFLIGPPLYVFSGLAESEAEYRNREAAVQLVLFCLLGFVVGAYFVVPALYGRRLRLEEAWKPFMHPRRLDQQWLVARQLMYVAIGIMFAYPVLSRLPTVRAIASQLLLVLDTSLTCMTLNVLLSGRRDRLAMIFGGVAVLAVYRAVVSGFLGGTMMTGLFLLALLTMGRSANWRNWVVLGLWLYLLLVPYGIWLSVRDNLRASINRNASISERFESIDFKGTEPRMLNFWDPHDLKLIQHRIDQSNLLAEAMEYTPAVEPYAQGGTIVDEVLVSLIPRFLWPEKPVALGGSAFVARFTGRRFDWKTSVGVNYLFEFYVNFGPLGAVACTGLFGIFCGAIEYYFFRQGPRSFCVEWTVILCMWQICASADRMAQLSMSLPVAIFDGWLIGRLFLASGWAPVYFRPPPSGQPSSTSIRLPSTKSAHRSAVREPGGGPSAS